MTRERLNEILVDGLRTHLATNKPVRLPEPARLIWRFFIDLSGRRSLGGMGPNPISYADIDAWQRVTGWALAEHHIEAIRALDDAWLEHAYRKPPEGVKALPQRSDHGLSPAMFDLAVS